MTDVGPPTRRNTRGAPVTEEDIRAARTAWWDAREAGEPAERVAELWALLVDLLRAEGEQHARERPVRPAPGRVDVPWRRMLSLLS